MNKIISFLVAAFATAVVVVGAMHVIGSVLGEYSILAWIAIGWFAFIAIMAKINS